MKCVSDSSCMVMAEGDSHSLASRGRGRGGKINAPRPAADVAGSRGEGPPPIFLSIKSLCVTRTINSEIPPSPLPVSKRRKLVEIGGNLFVFPQRAPKLHPTYVTGKEQSVIHLIVWMSWLAPPLQVQLHLTIQGCFESGVQYELRKRVRLLVKLEPDVKKRRKCLAA